MTRRMPFDQEFSVIDAYDVLVDDIWDRELTIDEYLTDIKLENRVEPDFNNWIAQVTRTPFKIDARIGRRSEYKELGNAYGDGAHLALAGMRLVLDDITMSNTVKPASFKSQLKTCAGIGSRRMPHIWSPQLQSFGRKAYRQIVPEIATSVYADEIDSWTGSLGLSAKNKRSFKTGFSSVLQIGKTIINNEVRKSFCHVMASQYSVQEKMELDKLADDMVREPSRD